MIATEFPRLTCRLLFFCFAVIGATFTSSTLLAADNKSFGSPDTEEELRFQQIFDKYNKEPVDEEKWQSMLGSRSSESYKIQTGDTLWDLSETMFGDGSYWPKLWSENHSIENPHQIIPKSQVRFIAGTEAQAPTVRIENSEAPKPYYVEDTRESLTAEEIAGGSMIENPDVIGRRPEIPPAFRKSAPVLKKFPPSFHGPVQSHTTASFDSTGLDIGIPKVLKSPAKVTLNSFIDSEMPRKLGFVKEIEVQESTASILQNVFLELGRKVKVGDRLNVVVVKHDVIDKDGKDLGHVIEVGGSVEVTEVVNEEDGIYKAIVVDCVMPIVINATVTDESLPQASFSIDGPRKDLKGMVVGGEYSADRKLFGTASVIYLNIGSEAGLQPGDLLAVHSLRKSRRPDTQLANVGRPVGVIKIAKVTKDASTALILNTIDEIRPGDATGGEFPVVKSYKIGARSQSQDIDKLEKQAPEDYTEEIDDSSAATTIPLDTDSDTDL